MNEPIPNISGLLVSADPARIDEVIAALAAIDGAEVTACDRERGRIVVVHEAADVGAEVAAFSRIRALPGAVAADLVSHYFGGSADDDVPAT